MNHKKRRSRKALDRSKKQTAPALEPERFKQSSQIRSTMTEPHLGGKTSIEQKKRSLFHYTSADGLIGILRSQSLHATHASFLNDSSECQILAELLKPMLTAENDVLVKKLIERKMLSSAILEDYGRGINELQAEKALEAITTATENVAPIYIFSFCIHSETDQAFRSGLLSQWRGYASGGFAIEFDENALDELLAAESKAFKYQGILTNEVSYTDHEKRANISSFEGLASVLTRRLFENRRAATLHPGESLDDIFGARNIEEYLSPYLATVPFLKNPGFSEEREYRIAAFCNRPGKSAPNDKRPYRETKFRGGKSLNPYIELFSGLGKRLPINRIIVGPHHNQENQTVAVKLLLEQFEIDAPITRSNLTLRT